MKDTPKRKKILGMNKRSLIYLRPSNRKRYVRLADNKLLTKKNLKKANIPTPNLFAVISTRRELLEFDWHKLPESFVIKPNLGFGGEGIIIIYGHKKNGNFVTGGGKELTEDDLVIHTSNILDGNFSLGNAPDVAICEQRIQLSSFMKPYSYKGIPDLRIVVYNKVPVMAMLRLPTKRSGGKANLHQGGVGVGIDIATGRTTHAVAKGFWLEKDIDLHPDTRAPLRGVSIPQWKDILLLAVRASIVSGLGYSGIDIVLDKELGPLILEINARPGLSIQNANLSPLDDRLKRVRGLTIETAERGVKIAQNLFGGEIEQEIEGMSGKQIISTTEKITLITKDNKKIEVDAKIDTGADISSMDIELARELGFDEVVNIYHKINPSGHINTMKPEEIMKMHSDIIDVKTIHSSHGTTQRILIPMTFYLADIKVVTKTTIIDRQHLTYRIIIGNRDLKNFLVDSSKTSSLLRLKAKVKKPTPSSSPTSSANSSAATKNNKA